MTDNIVHYHKTNVNRDRLQKEQNVKMAKIKNKKQGVLSKKVKTKKPSIKFGG